MDQLVPNDRLNIYLDSIRKIYWPKILLKLSKCENRVPIIPSFLPQYMAPHRPPATPRGDFFFLRAKLEHMPTLHKNDISAQNASKA